MGRRFAAGSGQADAGPGSDLEDAPKGFELFAHTQVSGNWRITFKFVDKDVETVDYEDYH